MKITLIEYDTELGNSILKFNITGNINTSHMNAFRRILYSSIKVRAFEHFNFKKNTSVFHEGYIKKRISQLPIWISDDIINNQKIYIQPPTDIKKKKNDMRNNDDDYNDDNYEFNEDIENKDKIKTVSLIQLTMYLKFTNKKKNEIVNVTTDDCLFYLGEKKIDSPFDQPLLLLKLQPEGKEQEIELSAITDINDENKHTIYSCVGLVGYTMVDNIEDEFIFSMQSRGQISEKQLLLISIEKIKKILDYFLSLVIKNKELNNVTDGSFNIINNNNIIDDLHTLGCLVVTELNKNDNVQVSTYNLTHLLSDTIIFKFILKKGNIINIIKESIEKIKKTFDNIKIEIENKI
jgi:DNA-directed RNA polymerase subunit L